LGLITQERLERECPNSNIKALYYDDFDLVRSRKVFRNFGSPFGLEKYSLDRRFVEIDEMRMYCQQLHIDDHRIIEDALMPQKFKIGFDTWEVVDIPRRSNEMTYTFNQSYRGMSV